jgi:hypothetical protein
MLAQGVVVGLDVVDIVNLDRLLARSDVGDQDL